MIFELRISLTGPKQSELTSSTALLFSGWLLQKLDVTVEGSVSSSEFFLSKNRQILSSEQESIRLKFDFSGTVENHFIHSVTFKFSPKCPYAGSVVFTRKVDAELDLIEAVINLDQQYKLSRQLEDDSQLSLLKRVFQVGDSFSNYLPSLNKARELVG